MGPAYFHSRSHQAPLFCSSPNPLPPVPEAPAAASSWSFEDHARHLALSSTFSTPGLEFGFLRLLRCHLFTCFPTYRVLFLSPTVSTPWVSLSFKSLYCSFHRHRISGGSKVRQMCSICHIIWKALLCFSYSFINICANCQEYVTQDYMINIIMILIKIHLNQLQ